MAETQQKTIKVQRKMWNINAAGWRKWDALQMPWLMPVAEEMLRQIHPRRGDHVLDVATGTGEPGLTIAKTLTTGSVTGIDISKEMIAVANSKAKKQRIGNYRAHVYSSNELPFGSDEFDSVVSRFGVMFFPNVLHGLSEMVRVVKPNRSVCVAVWAPRSGAYADLMDSVAKHFKIPGSPPDSPNPLRCSEPGKIISLLGKAGLKELNERRVQTTRTFESADQYWDNLLDMNSAAATFYRNCPPEKRRRTKASFMNDLKSLGGRNGRLTFEAEALVDSGRK